MFTSSLRVIILSRELRTFDSETYSSSLSRYFECVCLWWFCKVSRSSQTLLKWFYYSLEYIYGKVVMLMPFKSIFNSDFKMHSNVKLVTNQVYKTSNFLNVFEAFVKESVYFLSRTRNGL